MTIRPSDPPWVTNVLRNEIPKRVRAHKFAKRYDTPEAWRKCRTLRYENVDILKQLKQDHKDKLST